MLSALLWFYLAASAVVFVVYAVDKHAAIKGRWRIRERTLHLVALLGGWPGALIAQRLLHHKTRKQSFQRLFAVTVLVNCAAMGWLVLAPQAETLRSFLGFA